MVVHSVVSAARRQGRCERRLQSGRHKQHYHRDHRNRNRAPTSIRLQAFQVILAEGCCWPARDLIGPHMSSEQLTMTSREKSAEESPGELSVPITWRRNEPVSGSAPIEPRRMKRAHVIDRQFAKCGSSLALALGVRQRKKASRSVCVISAPSCRRSIQFDEQHRRRQSGSRLAGALSSGPAPGGALRAAGPVVVVVAVVADQAAPEIQLVDKANGLTDGRTAPNRKGNET